jgi:hypothetical protein
MYRLAPIKKAFRKFESIFFFLGVLAFSYLITFYKYSLFNNIIAFLYLARLNIYLLFFIYATDHIKKNKLSFDSGIILFAAVTAVTSIIQYFLYPDLRNLYYLGWDPHYFRTFGLFFDTSISSAIYGMILLYLINLKLEAIYENLLRWVGVAVYGLLGLLTYSRGFYIAVMITLVFYFIKRKLYLWIAGLILIFTVGILLIPKPTGESTNLRRIFTIESRLKDNIHAIEVWKKSPDFGIGYNRIPSIKTGSKMAHSQGAFSSSFTTILATGGLLGLFGFIWVLADLAKLSQVSKFYVVFISIFSIFDNIILAPFTLLLLLVLDS